MQIVVVEDSIMYQNLIGSCLQAWGFSPIIVKDGSQAWEVLRDPTSPKLVLLDLVLPGLDGIEICRRIRQTGPECPYTYVIVLTSRDGKQDMLEALEAGADDYIAKPFDEMELKARLLAGKRILDLHDELVAARESMRHAATHDFLTGLANRGEVWNCLSRELDRSRRENKPVGIMIADIDHFKEVNDTLGHLFGDEALKEIARRLRSKLRAYDTVGRYGGEEFLLVLPGCNMATTLARADARRSAPILRRRRCRGRARLGHGRRAALPTGRGRAAVGSRGVNKALIVNTT